MPFTSRAQARFMFAVHPNIAKHMAQTTGGKGSIKKLPNHSHTSPPAHPTVKSAAKKSTR